MYAHVFKARAADRKAGFAVEVTLSRSGDLSKRDEVVGVFLATNKAHARRIAAQHGAKAWNF